jgi:diadenylate cyclase
MRQFLRNHVFHNLGLKLFSLFLAVLLWLAVAHDPMAEVAINVPIEFHHVPENLEISSENIPQAQIRIRGPVRIIRELTETEIHPIIDLQGATTGERTYDLTSKEIHLPHDAEVVQIVPTQFRVSFDQRTQREVEVRPRVIGTFAAGYRISQVTADPKTITIVGPERRVKAIENAITDPVDASGVIGRATFTTHAYIADPMVRPVKSGVIHVTVVTEKSSRPGEP